MKVFTLMAVLLLLPWRSEAAFRNSDLSPSPRGGEGRGEGLQEVLGRRREHKVTFGLSLLLAPRRCAGAIAPSLTEEKQTFNYDAPRVCRYDEATQGCDYDATSTDLPARRIRPVLSNDSRRFAWSQRGYDSDFGIFLSRDSLGAQSYLSNPNGIGPWSYAAPNRW